MKKLKRAKRFNSAHPTDINIYFDHGFDRENRVYHVSNLSAFLQSPQSIRVSVAILFIRTFNYKTALRFHVFAGQFMGKINVPQRRK